MQRTKIQIGETYGVVVKRRQERNSPQPAKVVGFGGVYEKFRTHGFSGRYETKRDGIRVVFAEDMRVGHDYFEPMAEVEERMKADAIRKIRSEGKVVKAGDEYVLESAGCVLEPWADIEKRNAEYEIAMRNAKKRTDKLADEIEPLLRRTIEAMNARGVHYGDAYEASVKLKTNHGDGENGVQRTTGATFVIKLDAMAELLGVRS